MKIISLEAANLLRLNAVSIEPSGNVVEISGENGAGKSSTLQAIWMALGGKEAIPPRPVRKGASEGHVRLDLGDLIVTRKFKVGDDGAYTTSLVVENREGMRPQSPQNLLNSLVGRMAFDPIAFTRLSPAQQFEALRVFVPDFDFDAAAVSNRSDYERRTEHNRLAKTLRAQAAGIDVPEVVPDEVPDVSALVEELEHAGFRNTEIERSKQARDRVAFNIGSDKRRADDLDEGIKALRSRIADMETERDGLREHIKSEQARLDAAKPLPDPVDTGALRIKISEAEAVKAMVQRKRQRTNLIERAEEEEEYAVALTAAMAARRSAMAAAVAAAKMPVPGLAFGDGEVLLNDVPLEQASMAEQIRVSVALAAAMNPKIRIAHIRDGSLLDKRSWAALGELAESYDIQVWVETVDSGRAGAVVIEDGSVKEPAVAAAE